MAALARAKSTTSGDRIIEFAGVRPPERPPADASALHKFGPPVELFDGKSMDAWDLVRPDQCPVRLGFGRTFMNTETTQPQGET